MPNYLSTTEVAKQLNISQSTVCKWCRDGKLEGAIQQQPRGPWKIPVQTLARWQTSQKWVSLEQASTDNTPSLTPNSASLGAAEADSAPNSAFSSSKEQDTENNQDNQSNQRRNAQLVPISSDSDSDLSTFQWLIAFLAKVMTYLINGLGVSEAVQHEPNADQAIELDKELAWAYYERANYRYEEKDLNGAIADYDKAINLYAELTIAYIHRGNIYYEQGNLEEAKADYNQAIELDPTMALGYCNRGNIHSQQGDYEQALADYEQALVIDSKLVLVYWARGLLHRQIGNNEAALDDFYRYLQRYPEAENGAMFEEWIAELEEELVE